MKLSLVCVISLDGFINTLDRGKLNWSGPADKAWFSQETRRTGVAIMGSTTFDTFGGQPLPGRLNVVLTREPKRFARSDLTNVWATDLPPVKILEELAERGYAEASLIGGSKINRLFLDAGLIDEAWLTLTSHYFGAGIPLFDGAPTVDFELLGSKSLEANELLLHYQVKN